MAYPSVTYSFSNTTVADATQVNQNFTDLISGLSDGTKDLNINALAMAGNLTVNGNTTLGNASSDTFTVTASLASSIPILTTNSYDIGSSTLGLRALYFGANSQTVKIQGSGSMSATWTLTLPVTAGAGTQMLQTSGAGVSSWVYPQGNYVAKSGNYTLDAATDDIINFTAVATATLPTAVGITGKRFTIINSGGGYIITIATTSSQTVGGEASGAWKMGTKNDYMILVSDGANWLIIDEKVQILALYETAAGDTLNTGVNSNINYLTKVEDVLSLVTVGVGAWVPASGANATSNWKFTAPVTLYYTFTAKNFLATGGGWAAAETLDMYLYKNGSNTRELDNNYQEATHTTYVSAQGTCTILMTAGQTANIVLYQNSGGNIALYSGSARANYVEVKRAGK